MDWKAHIAIAALAGAAVSYFFFPSQILLFTLISAAAGLLPDLDIRNSRGSQIAYALAIALVLLAAYQLSFAAGKGWQEFLLYFAAIAAVLAVADFLIRPRHRGVMHGLLFLLALSAACWLLFGALAASAVFAGYFSHLLADRCIKLF